MFMGNLIYMKKKSTRRLKKRNPIAAELRKPIFRTRIELSIEQQKRKSDPWDKTTKHKDKNLLDFEDKI